MSLFSIKLNPFLAGGIVERWAKKLNPMPLHSVFESDPVLDQANLRQLINAEQQRAMIETSRRLAAGVRVSPSALDSAVTLMLTHYLEQTNRDHNPNCSARMKAVELIRALDAGIVVHSMKPLKDWGV